MPLMSTTPLTRNPLPVLFGLLLALFASVAAVFLGAAAGMTLSIALPAALVSLALLTWVLRTGGAAENALVQTIASTAAAGATAAVFFSPAFLITDLWKEVPYWTVALLVLGGGVSGVLFATHFRKLWGEPASAFPFPEAEACGRLLVELTKRGPVRAFLAVGILTGILIKSASAIFGALRSSIEGAWGVSRTVFYAGAEASPALLGIGYLAGARTATALFIGSAVSWFIALPVLGWDTAVLPDPLGWSWLTWNTRLRYLGVGALGIAAVWSLYQNRALIASGVRGLFGGRTETVDGADLPRTLRVSLMVAAALALGVAAWIETRSFTLVSLGVVAAIVLGLVASLVGGTLAGLVGAALVPVTALGLGILLYSGPILQWLAPSVSVEPLLLLVAFAASAGGLVAGALSQSFRVGTLCGATPARIQGGALLGVAASALIVAVPLRYLHFAYGAGTGGRGALTPTQANLFAGMAHGIVSGGDVPWYWIGIGVKIALGFVVLDEALRARKSGFRLPILAVALGMYVPLSLALPICVGGWLSKVGRSGTRSPNAAGFASGLIAGEALVGAALGILVVGNPQWVPIRLVDSWMLSLGAMGLLAVALGMLSKKEA